MIRINQSVGALQAAMWHRILQMLERITDTVTRVTAEEKSEIKRLLHDIEVMQNYVVSPDNRFKELVKLYNEGSYLEARVVASAIYDASQNEPQLNATLDINQNSASMANVSSLKNKRYFEVLFVGNWSVDQQEKIRERLKFLSESSVTYKYDIRFCENAKAAIELITENYQIQSCVILEDHSKIHEDKVQLALESSSIVHQPIQKIREIFSDISRTIKEYRPEIDVFLGNQLIFDPIFHLEIKSEWQSPYNHKNLEQLHVRILEGVAHKNETPFYTALKNYSQKPTRVFHALPCAKGESVFNSKWIGDFGSFYGKNFFLAETSATNGGLDSLLQPTGPLKKAQKLASEAFGSNQTFFSTNGTSTSNKIVLQALLRPDDIVLIERNSHKSHHYGLVLTGSSVVYMDPYSISEYCLYGAIPLDAIINELNRLKQQGNLERVKMIILTNCTFDGIIYNPELVMEKVLAIKPDMIFLWDEAWFAFATFSHKLRQRTAMYAARKLSAKYNSLEYRQKYNELLERAEVGQDISLELPDPDLVKIRVYVTQSSHKTLSSFRQSSMVHVYDDEFNDKVADTFYESYMTHSSTSSNYQILASIDVGRMQMVLEGPQLVNNSINLAMTIKTKIKENPQLSKYFDVHTEENLIPLNFRTPDKSSVLESIDPWQEQEFVLDPTKINLFIGKTGLDGETFKNKYLMDQFNIQVNKTSKNTVLLMTNIGTDSEAVSYLLSALLQISKQLDQCKINGYKNQEELYDFDIKRNDLPASGYFHSAFQFNKDERIGNLRKAFYHSYSIENCLFMTLDECESEIDQGKELVSSSFIVPYPPGFPVIVPGEMISKEKLTYLRNLDQSEVHGYKKDQGLKVMKMISLIELTS